MRIIERRPSDWDRTARLDLPPLEPHSPTWIVALADADPFRAAYVSAVTAAAERSDCCSVCGDAPASDYQLADFPIPERFCDFCRDVQTEMRATTARPVARPKGDGHG